MIVGSVPQLPYNKTLCNLSWEDTVDDQNERLKRFWEIEEMSSSKPMSLDEQKCEQHFQATHQRDANGRFIVLMPLKQSPTVLGNSFHTAEQQFLNLERKLIRNTNLYERYKLFMSEYIEHNLMSLCEPRILSMKYYLPHHGVINQWSITTKLRVVFKGSAQTETGFSLNSLQLVGPTIQQDLVSILLRFRSHRIVICADIEKMYRQVLIKPDERNLQCILWRFSPAEALKTYTLNTVTYGTTAAPFLTIRSLYQLGIECETSAPDISNVIKSDFYVDDLITGVSTSQQGNQLVHALNQTLLCGGFKLRKWLSNCPKVLEGIDDTDLHPRLFEFEKNEFSDTRTNVVTRSG